MGWRLTLALNVFVFATTLYIKSYMNRPRPLRVTCAALGGADGQLCIKWTITAWDMGRSTQEALNAANAECHANCPKIKDHKCWGEPISNNAFNYTCVHNDWFPSGFKPIAEFEAERLQNRKGRYDNAGLV